MADTTASPTEFEAGNENSSVTEETRAAAEAAAELLRAMASPHRMMILCLLMEERKTVTEICQAIGARQSLISQHLTRLRLDGLVKAERRGHYAYYSLTDTIAKDLVATLHAHYCSARADSRDR